MTSLEFGTLWAILEKQDWDINRHMLINVAFGEGNESWLHQFQDEYVGLLAALDGDGMQAVAQEWGTSEEFDNATGTSLSLPTVSSWRKRDMNAAEFRMRLESCPTGAHALNARSPAPRSPQRNLAREVTNPMSTPKQPNARRRTLLRLAGMVPIACCVQAQPVNVDTARFENAQPAIERFIATAKPRLSGDQHFCVVTYPVGDGYAWVHWREGNQLIYWRGAAAGPPDDTIARSTRKLDLAKDVVATDDDIAGSTYLVSRRWVNERLAECQARGKRYVLRGS